MLAVNKKEKSATPKSIFNKSSHTPRSSSSFLLLILVANKPADPLTRAELRQLLCRRNPRYSPRYQLVHQLCLFDPLADSPSCLRCIFSVRGKKNPSKMKKYINVTLPEVIVLLPVVVQLCLEIS